MNWFFPLFCNVIFSPGNFPCSEVYVTLPEVFMFYNIGLYFLAYGIKTELWLLWSEAVKELSRLTMMNNSDKETRASWVQTRKQRLKCEAEMRKLRPERLYDTQLVSDRARLVPHKLKSSHPSCCVWQIMFYSLKTYIVFIEIYLKMFCFLMLGQWVVTFVKKCLS